jgi:hypothetical protein
LSAKKPDIPPEPTALTVTGPAQGRWRAGRRFGALAVVLPLAELTDAEIAAIQGDPALVTSLA